MIKVDNLHKAYDTMVAVAGLSFQVLPGQILGLVGPNGAGKTTTMRALAGTIPPSRGKMSVADYDVCQQPLETKKRLAYVPDDPQLFGDLTVQQHMAFFGSAYRVTQANTRSRELLRRFRLDAKLTTRAADLSRGMRQKLAICCAYLYDPLALLLDEPMTGLDPEGIRTLKRSLAERSEQGAAIVISSHLLAMVEDVCTHVLILDRGQSQFFGSIEQLKSAFTDDGHSISLEEIFFKATLPTTDSELVSS